MQGLIKLIKFYSTKCKPCEVVNGLWHDMKHMLGTPQELEYMGVKVLEINTDENEQAAIDCELRAVPSLLAVVEGPGEQEERQGEIVDSYKGNISTEEFLERAITIIKKIRGVA